MNKPILLKGAILGAIAVVLGALGAHALKNVLTPDQLLSFETGVRYQMYHALLLVILSVSQRIKPIGSRYLVTAVNLIFFGVILFSGSIYLLTIKNILEMEFLKFVGPITPIGGILMVIGWVLLIWEGLKK